MAGAMRGWKFALLLLVALMVGFAGGAWAFLRFFRVDLSAD